MCEADATEVTNDVKAELLVETEVFIWFVVIGTEFNAAGEVLDSVDKEIFDVKCVVNVLVVKTDVDVDTGKVKRFEKLTVVEVDVEAVVTGELKMLVDGDVFVVNIWEG